MRCKMMKHQKDLFRVNSCAACSAVSIMTNTRAGWEKSQMRQKVNFVKHARLRYSLTSTNVMEKRQRKQKQRLVDEAQIGFSPETAAQLKSLRERAGFRDNRETINHALTILDWAVTRHEEGTPVGIFLKAPTEEGDDVFRQLETDWTKFIDLRKQLAKG